MPYLNTVQLFACVDNDDFTQNNLPPPIAHKKYMSTIQIRPA